MHELDCHKVWNRCLQVIREKIGEQQYSTWFEPIIPLHLSDGILTIQVPSQYFYEYMEEHFASVLHEAIYKNLGPGGRLHYSIIVDKGNEQNKPLSINIPTSKHETAKQKTAPAPKEQKSPFELRSLDNNLLSDSQLNPFYTFDSYVEGDCNRLARSAGIAVASKPGTTSFNPLMLYGGVGLGKTHLVHAIGNKIKDDFDDKFIIYVSSEKFTNQFIDALKNGDVQSFTNFYLQVDVLILDDVQFLAGKDKTQEIFFHIFNHLKQSQKQIIMTSDCSPKDLKGLHERLVSRFKWGLTADLQLPDFETRVAIIQKKMQADGIDLPYDVVEYLAQSVDTNIRELEGVLISMVAQSSLNRKEFDINLAKQILQNIVHNMETEVDIDGIQKSVSEYFAVPVDALKAKTRKKEIVMARQVAMYFAKEYTNYSLKTIGQYFGGRDHSTVIHAIQSVNELIDTNQKFKVSILELQKKLKVKAM